MDGLALIKQSIKQTPYFECEDGLLYCADCMDILPQLPDKCIPLCLTDPPYGINIQQKDGSIGGTSKSIKKRAGRINHLYHKFDDSKTVSDEELTEIFRVSKNQIIWGAEYITDKLPPSRCWLVWYKRINGQQNRYGDCEFAWTSFDKPNRLFQHLWMGFLRDSENQEHYHATQKPVALMRWCIDAYTKEGDTVLDCFLGSGTTAASCKRLGRKFIGIEISEEYCRIAKDRIQAEQKGISVKELKQGQGVLFEKA